jgi:hypothetical protein
MPLNGAIAEPRMKARKVRPASLLLPVSIAPAPGAAGSRAGRRGRPCDPTGKSQARWKTALNAFDVTFDGWLSAARQ